MSKNLVIVESPAKAETIGKYLGPDYTVKASMGHVRDLPKSRLGVDIEGGFIPDYQPIKGKDALIADLKKAAKKSDRVYLATDPDREGEAISWHLKEIMGLPEEKVSRVTFNEITKNVVRKGIENPREIDQNLVDAQQARRILDRIVGYQLSPLLWKKIRRGLSAGRVQSVATRIVAEREEEIRKFQPKEYWSLEVELERIAPKIGKFKASFYGKEKKLELKTEEEVHGVLDAVKGKNFLVENVKRQDKVRQPSPPFITSTLQQEASRRYGMTPRRTMSTAQQLYEGVNVQGVGTIGLITYMRTDSLRLSEEALSAAEKFIRGRYGDKYYPEKTRRFKTKAGAQDAHEAIRPTNVSLIPSEIRKSLTNDQYHLYDLIWKRFIASQMAVAVFDSVTIGLKCGEYTFRANHSTQKFNGFMAVYVEERDDEEEKAGMPLPDLTVGEEVEMTGSTPEQHFTQPPARYTEATLIRALEEKGIGRPSTYAPTISTILSREYVVKEGKYLRTTPLGEVVTQLMKDRFPDIVDYAFTAEMEENLDEVEAGNKNWKEVLSEFYKDFSAELKKAENEMDGKRIKVPDEVTDEICPVCGRNLVVKSGKFGRFLACPGYPECTFTKPLVIEMPGRCPKCGKGRILKKTSRNGYTYYGCEFNNNKAGESCDFMTWDVPVKDNCPVCGWTMFKKSGRGRKTPFCINPNCSNFTPEDKRGGYHKKTVNSSDSGKVSGEKGSVKRADEKKSVKKTSKTSSRKKTSTSTKKTTVRTASKKETASKVKKASTEKTVKKKSSEET